MGLKGSLTSGVSVVSLSKSWGLMKSDTTTPIDLESKVGDPTFEREDDPDQIYNRDTRDRLKTRRKVRRHCPVVIRDQGYVLGW